MLDQAVSAQRGNRTAKGDATGEPKGLFNARPFLQRS